MNRRRLLWPLMALLTTGCAVGPSPAVPQPKGDVLRATRKPMVFEGTVVEVFPSPRIWCDLAVDLATFQAVRYRVDGQKTPDAVVFYFLNRPAGCADCQPALATSAFAVGSHHQVKAWKTSDGDLISWPPADDFQRRR